MSLTLADAWDAALLRIGLPEDDGYLTQEFKRMAVSTAQRDVASQVDWPELAGENTFTVDDDPPYDLPALENFLRLQWVAVEHETDATPTLLLPKQRRELLQYDNQDPGYARYYAIVSDGLGSLKLWIAPRPRDDEVIRYSYIRKPSPIQNDTDTLIVPDHLVEAIVVRTMYHIAIRKGDMDRAAEMRVEWQEMLRFLKDEVLTSRGPLLPKVRQDGI
jgi:hypothetical protein